MTLKVTHQLQGFSSVVLWPFVQHFTRFQMTQSLGNSWVSCFKTQCSSLVWISMPLSNRIGKFECRTMIVSKTRKVQSCHHADVHVPSWCLHRLISGSVLACLGLAVGYTSTDFGVHVQSHTHASGCCWRGWRPELVACIGVIEDAYIVPVSISYDKLVDGNFIKEQMVRDTTTTCKSQLQVYFLFERPYCLHIVCIMVIVHCKIVTMFRVK